MVWRRRSCCAGLDPGGIHVRGPRAQHVPARVRAVRDGAVAVVGPAPPAAALLVPPGGPALSGGAALPLILPPPLQEQSSHPLQVPRPL